MALSQANLTIGVGVDTSQLKVGLATAKAEVRRATADLNKAIKVGDPVAIAASQRALLGATREVDRLSIALAQNTRVTAVNTAATRDSTRAHVAHALSVKEVGLWVNELGKVAGISVLQMKGLKTGIAGLIAASTIKLFTDAVDKLTELQNTIKAIGGATGSGDVGGLKAARAAITATGQEASIADTAIAAFNKKLDESRLKQGSGVVVSGGRGAQGAGTLQDASTVLRGGQTSAINWDDINKALDVNTGKYRDNIAIRAEVARKILAESDVTTRNKASLEAFNVPFAQMVELLQKWAAQTKPDIGPSPEALEQARQAKVAIEDLKTAFSDLQTVIVTEFGPSVTAALKAVTRSGFAAEISRQLRLAKSDLQQFKDAADALLAKWNEIDAWVKSHSGLGEKLLQGSPGVTFQPGELSGGMAAGGPVRGPGTGTSDSILARLSNGEFVMNASSVRRLGVGYLNALNSFAEGGIVRFAEGGLVGASSGGGQPVHLHLGGQSFALSGSQPVVSALVSEAHSQQMKSAGVKPSWFAGRSGGR